MAAKRVMIVDDSPDSAEVMEIVLHMMGHTTAVASNGFDALALAEVFLPDVAFLDIVMPVMDGFELASALQAVDGLDHIVLIALTARNAPTMLTRSKLAGFQHYIYKPAKYEQIKTAMLFPHIPGLEAPELAAPASIEDVALARIHDAGRS